METKKLGFLIIGMSIVLGFVMFNFMNQISLQGQQLNCNPTQECQQINSVLGVSHVAIGFLAFIFALGFYLLFFNKNEEEILRKYKDIESEIKKEIKPNAIAEQDDDFNDSIDFEDFTKWYIGLGYEGRQKLILNGKFIHKY